VNRIQLRLSKLKKPLRTSPNSTWLGKKAKRSVRGILYPNTEAKIRARMLRNAGGRQLAKGHKFRGQLLTKAGRHIRKHSGKYAIGAAFVASPLDDMIIAGSIPAYAAYKAGRKKERRRYEKA